MTEPTGGPEKLQTRPERKFEGRRKFIGLGVVGILLIGVWFVINAFSNPTGGISGLGMKPPTATPTRQARATITVISIAAPTLTPVPQPTITVRPVARTEQVGQANAGNLVCWANQDITLDDKTIIPRDAMIRIAGWTAARGGMVDVQGLWVNESWVRCNGDVRQFERTFVMVPTRSRATGGASSDAPARIVYVPVTTTPGAPAATPTPFNGMWFDGSGCWTINVNYVREIWINGKGVSNGVYCGVSDARIVMVK